MSCRLLLVVIACMLVSSVLSVAASSPAPSSKSKTSSDAAAELVQQEAAVIVEDAAQWLRITDTTRLVMNAWQSQVIARVPSEIRAHVKHIVQGLLSVVFGPLNFIVEVRSVTNFWSVSVPLETPAVFISSSVEEFHRGVLRRFEFSLGSFVGELLVFLWLAPVVRKTWLHGKLKSFTHENMVTMIVLSAIPLGVLDISAVVSALCGATISAFLPALFIGKVLRPYVTTGMLWALRWLSTASCCPEIRAVTVAVISTFNRLVDAQTKITDQDTTIAVAVLVALVAVVAASLAIAFPSDSFIVDDEDEGEDAAPKK